MRVIEARSITRRFGPIQALDGIDVTVEAGEVVGVLGPNGAGKTTTIRMALDIFKPDRGLIALFGRPARRPATASATSPRSGAFTATSTCSTAWSTSPASRA